MENKMYARKAFKCGICGKEYENVMDRAHCELTCGKKREEEVKKAAEAKKEAERKARHAEVEKLLHQAITAVQEYCKDYGYFETEDSDLNFLWPSRLHHYFL